MRAEPVRQEGRWAGRPVVAFALLAVAHLVPIAASVATSAILSRQLAAPDGLGDTILRWSLLIGVSTIVLVLVDRLARRLLPLAALFKLSMVFPDRAPRRLAVAIRSGSVRNLQQRLEEAKALDHHDEPARAAEVILSLVGALHGHDRHTRGHSERVRWFADLIADELRLPVADRDRLRWAALLHDIGKLHIRQRILNKPAKLNSREWRHIHRHPEEGARIAAPLSDWLGDWSLTIAQHHEKYDGTGYPAGLSSTDIALGARIVAVADAYEVMTAVRAYKKAMSAGDARRELTRCAGTHFDPAIVRAFLNVSIGRLRWVAGPTAWIAQLPFIGWIPRIAEGAAGITGQAAGVVGAAAGAATLSTSAVLPGSTVVEPPPASFTPVLLDIPVPAPPDSSSVVGSVEVLGETITRGPLPAAPAAGAPAVDLTPVVPTTTTTIAPPAGNGNGHTDPPTDPAEDDKGRPIDPGNGNGNGRK